MAKEGRRQLYETIIKEISENKDKIPVLTIEIKRRGFYKRYLLEEYLETLIKYTSLKQTLCRYIFFQQASLNENEGVENQRACRYRRTG
jgi:hypothetical protein